MKNRLLVFLFVLLPLADFTAEPQSGLEQTVLKEIQEAQSIEQALQAIHTKAPTNQKFPKLMNDKDVVNMIRAALKYKFGPLERHLIQFTQENNVNLIKMILPFVENLNMQDGYGATALMWAAKNANNEVVQMLLDRGADPNAKSAIGSTALFYTNDSIIVRTLLDAGANPNIQNKFGRSPLMVAAHNGNAEIVQILLDAKADPNLKSKYGRNAAQLARENGHHDSAQMIEEYAKNLPFIDSHLAN